MQICIIEALASVEAIQHMSHSPIRKVETRLLEGGIGDRLTTVADTQESGHASSTWMVSRWSKEDVKTQGVEVGDAGGRN